MIFLSGAEFCLCVPAIHLFIFKLPEKTAHLECYDFSEYAANLLILNDAVAKKDFDQIEFQLSKKNLLANQDAV